MQSVAKIKVEAGVGKARNADRINFGFKQIKRKLSSNKLNSVKQTHGATVDIRRYRF